MRLDSDYVVTSKVNTIEQGLEIFRFALREKATARSHCSASAIFLLC